MARNSPFSHGTPLQLALERGTQAGGDLADELRRLGEYPVKSKGDAEAICRVLALLAANPPSGLGGKTALGAVVNLLQTVEGRECPAFPVLAEQGIPLLAQIVGAAPEESELRALDPRLFALKILALYGTREGTDAVIRAVREPVQPDGFMWSIILQSYTERHPERERLLRELSDPLPASFIAVALLDCANALHRAGASDRHPFDSQAGIAQLEHWLTDDDDDHFSYAVSAAVALPFIQSPDRDRLLALAFDHKRTEVKIEAAWAAAKLGHDAGIKWLARLCLDVNHSSKAKQYLAELGRADAIPAETEDPEFQAKAEFAQWLAHPNELARPPDELEVIDQRELDWPPEREPKSLWLIQFRAKDESDPEDDQVDVGLVGSVTFCLLGCKLAERPPEDGYAIHCYWELESRGLITEAEVPEGSTEYDHMLRQHKQPMLNQKRILSVAELAPQLKYPQRMVALATAASDDETGWLVLDGPRSRWYAQSEMPADVPDKTVVMVHVGRVLLGFTEEPDRREYLPSAEPEESPEQSPEEIIEEYEAVLKKARSSAAQAKKLLSAFSPLGEKFESYVNALIEVTRHADVAALVETLRPHWDHNLGYGKLGSAAFRSGHDELAEPFLVKLRDSYEDWFRSNEINDLAEIWQRQGRSEDAHALLIEALKRLLGQSREATDSDCDQFEEWFQNRRSAYLRILSDRGEAELQRQGIPATTLARS
jgi:hypothetical protein